MQMDNQRLIRFTQMDNQRLIRIAKTQKLLLWAVLLLVLANVASFGMVLDPRNNEVDVYRHWKLIPMAIALLAIVLTCFSVIKLTILLSQPESWVLGTVTLSLFWIPFLGLLLLLLMNQRITLTLTKHGLDVGFMGVKRAALEKLAAEPTPPPLPETAGENTSV